MFRVARQIHFCYGHRLMEYEGKCRHPHGHNGRVEVEVRAARLDRRGMVVDFSDIKAALHGWIDDNFDHAMILRRDDPLAAALRAAGEPVYVMNDNPTAENIAREIFRAGRARGLPLTRVTLWETENSFVTYEPRHS